MYIIKYLVPDKSIFHKKLEITIKYPLSIFKYCNFYIKVHKKNNLSL